MVVFKPDWENAKVVNVDGAISLSTSMVTNLSDYHVDKYYALVMKMNGTTFESKILDINSKEAKGDKEVLSPLQMYQSAFTTDDLSKDGQIINAEIKVFGAHFKNQSNIVYSENGKSILPLLYKVKADNQIQEQQCFDAYMVTRVYDFYGNLLDIYQEYLGFQLCYDNLTFDPTGLGGGGGGVEEQTIAWGEAVNQKELATSGSVFNDEEGVPTREVEIGWKIYSRETIQFRSIEKVNLKLYDIFINIGTEDFWYFGETLRHQTAMVVGLTQPDETISVTVNNTQSWLTNGTGHIPFRDDLYKTAYMKIKFQEIWSFTNVRGQRRTHYSPQFASNESWDASEL